MPRLFYWKRRQLEEDIQFNCRQSTEYTQGTVGNNSIEIMIVITKNKFDSDNNIFVISSHMLGNKGS